MTGNAIVTILAVLSGVENLVGHESRESVHGNVRYPIVKQNLATPQRNGIGTGTDGSKSHTPTLLQNGMSTLFNCHEEKITMS